MSVFKAVAQRSSLVGQVQHTRHNRTCPSCGNRNRLLLICARNATLGTQVVKHSWAGPFNDDRKLIAFSDSVQDAEHRAGFFFARAYLNNVRDTLARLIDSLVVPAVGWVDFLAQLSRRSARRSHQLRRMMSLALRIALSLTEIHDTWELELSSLYWLTIFRRTRISVPRLHQTRCIHSVLSL